MKTLQKLRREVTAQKQSNDEAAQEMLAGYLIATNGNFDDARLLAQAMITINEQIYEKLTDTQIALVAVKGEKI